MRKELKSTPSCESRIPDVSLAIPCYNEADVIRNTVSRLVRTFRAEDIDLELVLVDNGSVGAVASYTFTNVQANHTIAASFSAVPVNFTINATAGSVRWNNGSMANDSVAPLTNTSVRSGDGWLYAGWLPAQQDGVQVSYTINATNGAETHLESYFLTVSSPAPSGLTTADQEQWILTLAASLSMAISTLAVLYWYTGRRLRREGK